MNEENQYTERSEKDAVRMFYMTRKGKRLRKFKKRRRVATAITSIVLVLAILTTIGFGVGYWLLGMGMRNENVEGNSSTTSTTASGLMYSEHPGVSYILVVGIDNKGDYSDNGYIVDEAYHTDIIAVACIDHDRGTVNVMQIPRDLFIGTDIPSKKLNAVYAFPPTGMSRMDALRQRLAGYLGVPIDHYVIFTIKGFMNVVDALGGVEIYIEREEGLYVENQYNYQQYKIGPGWVTLDGNAACGFVRKRTGHGGSYEGYLLGDPDRLKAQRLMYVALAKKLMNMSVTQMASVASKCISEVSTSMTLNDIVGYAMDVRSMCNESADGIGCISVWGVPGQQCMYRHYDEEYQLSYFSIHKQEFVDLWNAHMNPYGEPITVNSIKIRELHTEAGIPFEPNCFETGGSLSDIQQEHHQ